MYLIVWLIVLCPIIYSQTVELDKETYFRYDVLNATLVIPQEVTDFTLYSIFIENIAGRKPVYDITLKEYNNKNHFFQPFVLEAGEKFLTLYNIDSILFSAKIGFRGKFTKEVSSFVSKEIKIKAQPISKKIFDMVQERVQIFGKPNIYFEDESYMISIYAGKYILDQMPNKFTIGMCYINIGCESIVCTSAGCYGNVFDIKISYDGHFIYLKDYNTVKYNFFFYIKYIKNMKTLCEYSDIIPKPHDMIELTYIDKDSFSFIFHVDIDEKAKKIKISKIENLLSDIVILATYSGPFVTCKNDGEQTSEYNNNIILFHNSDKNPIIISVIYSSSYSDDDDYINNSDSFSFILDNDSKSFISVENTNYQRSWESYKNERTTI